MIKIAIYLSLIIILTSCNHNNHKLMTNSKFEQLVNQYIEAWSTTNSDRREKLVQQVYSRSADFYANEPGDKAVNHHGWSDINKNIAQVNDRLVVKNGLKTELTSFSINHQTLRVAWQMKTQKDEVALQGMNFLVLDNSGKIYKDFIFIN